MHRPDLHWNSFALHVGSVKGKNYLSVSKMVRKRKLILFNIRNLALTCTILFFIAVIQTIIISITYP